MRRVASEWGTIYIGHHFFLGIEVLPSSQLLAVSMVFHDFTSILSRSKDVAGKDESTEISSEIENRARASPSKTYWRGVRASLDFSQNRKSRRGELF